MASTIRIKVPDMRELRADLESVELGLGRALNEAALLAAEPILAEAKRLAPFDAEHRGWKGAQADDPGHIRDSLHVRPAPYGAALYTTHPGAPVHEFGGTIAPNGHPFRITQKLFAQTAGETQAGQAAERADEALERLLREHNLL